MPTLAAPVPVTGKIPAIVHRWPKLLRLIGTDLQNNMKPIPRFSIIYNAILYTTKCHSLQDGLAYSQLTGALAIRRTFGV